MEKTIHAIIIVEMIGKPADYLKETLEKYIEKIGAEKGIKILKNKINEAKKIEDSGLLSNFAEVELEIENLQILLNLIFVYMPSHIEVISPEEIRLRNFEFNSLVNDLTRRMLQYDSIAKKMIYEKKVLENQLRLRGEKPAVQETETKPTFKEKKKVKKSRKKRI